MRSQLVLTIQLYYRFYITPKSQRIGLIFINIYICKHTNIKKPYPLTNPLLFFKYLQLLIWQCFRQSLVYIISDQNKEFN